ncbi:MAG: right-handed parallel beta-helix repeat-containing protein [Gammaproteobacteria bacterium]|nr:right-handed parallel beta-helix repeat-containing protein [Gammaproteobacteria bacterium]
MKRAKHRAWLARAVRPLVFMAGAVVSVQAAAQIPSLNVTRPDGTSLSGYRWLIEEDRTHHVVPGETCVMDPANPGDASNMAECLSVDFHRSYMPVVAEGYHNDALPNLDPGKHYFVSILPYSAGGENGSGLSGSPIKPGQTAVNVVVNDLPTPTAQIRIFVFHDNYPINNAPDLPEEQGLAGFRVLLFDAAGRFGIAGGQVLQDAFGNPLGTTYNAGGDVATLGDGNIYSGPDGYVTVKNLAPGKYGVQIVPPAGKGWQQTSTIEGTKTIDAWVKANEPPYFMEFGPPGPHVFVGFVQDSHVAPWVGDDGQPLLTGGATVHGRIMNIHGSRPPDFTFYTGAPFPACWVGLNDLSVGLGKGLYATPCNDDSSFSIPDVPPGNYQLAVWDANLDVIFGSYNFTVAENTTEMNLLDVPVFNWFAKLENQVFHDTNENGFWDEGESPIPEQNINLRWRDGTIYQAMPTDLSGASPFDEVFPFFSWLVAEVDFARFKATGATVVVDAGGPIDPTDPWTFDGNLNPQAQSENGGAPYRVETGPVLTQAFQGFLGQKSVIQWGKKAYDPGENGGISGMVIYATTRAEDDPRYAVAEEWEPGIPRIPVALYFDDGNGGIKDLDGDGVGSPAVFDWNAGTGSLPVVADPGDAIQITYTDSWDDNLPTGCQGDVFMVDGIYPTDCYDGLRNYNQVRPGVFDGGYAFTSYHPGGIASGSAEADTLPPGDYIVGVGNHPVYKVVKEEDKNVDFGDNYAVAPLLLPPACVGDNHEVPALLSMQTDRAGNLLPGQTEAIGAPFAGQQRPLCDRKQISLADGRNAAVDFFLHTQVPIAGHVVGFILDDLSNEFDPTAPAFGEKYSPPFLPVSVRDWTGREIHRVYSDRWGRFNALVPSTYTMNLPMPSGASPNMLVTCMNSAGDPHFDRQYSQFCYTFQYMPGTTTYLDTPVVPVAAFTGPGQFPVDCEYQAGTPVIREVIGSLNGPYIEGNQTLTIRSMGSVQVTNPRFGEPGEPRLVTRDFGFGDTPGTVTISDMSLSVVTWNNETIVARLGRQRPPSGQLVVTRGDNFTATETSVTVTVGPIAGEIIEVSPGPGTPIQDAIDAASAGDLILVAPGTYEEMVVMWKPVQLQGAGAATVINAVNAPGEKLQAWRDKVWSLFDSGAIDLLPSQTLTGPLALADDQLMTEEGAGVAVFAKQGQFVASPNARIDGLTITGADNGGGIVVNGYADYLAISNNRVYGNAGVYGGGIRVGHPALVLETAAGLVHQDGDNDNVNIHHNWVAQNGGLFSGGAGGGIGLMHGTDGYQVTDNFICGNFTQGDGGGIGHLGMNDEGVIARNRILFNQSFSQGVEVSGGGIFVGGAPSLAGTAGRTEGAGSLTIEDNLIQGNLAGAGDGGGIRLALINGQDIAFYRNRPADWHRINLVNNIIVNNVAGYAGGGISLQDAAAVSLVGNVIANNDSTATTGAAFAPPLGTANDSVPQPAGIVAYAHSVELAAAFEGVAEEERLKYGVFSNPDSSGNIVQHNRAFSFHNVPYADPPEFGLNPNIGAGDPPVYWDLAVMPAGTGALSMMPTSACFVQEYFNGERGQTVLEVENTTTISAQPAFDEGGNFIDVRYGPLSVGDSDYTDVACPTAGGTGIGIMRH